MNEASGTEALDLPDWNFTSSRSVDLKPIPTTIGFEQGSSHSIKIQGSSGSGGSLQDALSFLSQLYHAYGGNVAAEELKKLVDIFSSKIVQIFSKSDVESKESSLHLEESSCPICYGVICEPQTMRCGHSYCKKCLQMEHVGNQCRLCSYKLTNLDVMHTKTNVLLVSVIDKLWPNNSKTASLRNEGNDLFEKKMREEAVSRYTEAIKLSPTDHLSLCNRSHALLSLGRSEEALSDAEAAVKYCPTWFKGYFRKAVTLISLGRYEDAFTTLTLCIYLVKQSKKEDEAAMNRVKSEMEKVLHKLFQSGIHFGQPSLRRHTLDQSLFSPYPSQKKSRKRTHRQWECNTCSESECNSSGDEGESGLKDAAMSRNSRRTGCTMDTLHLHSHKGSATFGGGQDQTVVRIQRTFSRSLQELTAFEHRLKSKTNSSRSIDETLIVSSDFECSLCYRLIYQPVTTSCGHTYCRCCLERCLDHSPTCPLCKTSLENVAFRRHAVTHTLDIVISKYLSKEHADRVNQHLEELADGDVSGKNQEIEIPIFVCTMAFPTVPCPLHVFEPRYRLMIRRCMESGTRRFGMCSYLQEGDHNYGDYGTLLEIRSVQYFPDGRSVVDTIGIRRFKVLKKSMKDGYNTASIEFVEDRPIEDTNRAQIQESHEKVFNEATEWLQSINQVLRQRIFTHFGQMPIPEDDWIKVAEGPSWTWWLLAILPLDAKAQLAILSMNSLQKRLESIHKVLRYVKSRLT